MATTPVALVTGGASGIGAATSTMLAQRGYLVAVADLDADRTRPVVDSLAGSAGFAVDVSDSTSVSTLFAQVVQRFGRLDAVVTAAGVDDPTSKAEIGAAISEQRPIDVTRHLSDERWRRLIDINLTGTFYTVREALTVFIPQGSGTVVTIASSAAVDAPAGYVNYSASKAGVVGLTQAAAKEAIGHGVRINCVAPGPTVTPMTARTPAANDSVSVAHGLTPRDPASAAEIAEVICFLAGDASANIVGDVVLANGGRFTR